MSHACPLKRGKSEVHVGDGGITDAARKQRELPKDVDSLKAYLQLGNRMERIASLKRPERFRPRGPENLGQSFEDRSVVIDACANNHPVTREHGSEATRDTVRIAGAPFRASRSTRRFCQRAGSKTEGRRLAH